MNVLVVGAGYVGLVTAACLAESGNRVVGLVTAACLAESGNRVVGVDQDPARVALLQAGGIPIYEPGLDELVVRNQHAGRLSFSTSLAQAIADADVIFIAVGTPPMEDGSADLQHVLAVAEQIGHHLTDFKVVVNKSTVPVGTAADVHATILARLQARGLAEQAFVVVSNPEFLKEGAAIEDFMRPDRIVIGVPDTPLGDRARQVMTRLYQPFNRHHDRTVWMDVVSAELTKYAANAMLATRISFMNEMALLADQLGADVDCVRRGMGSDQRIGHSFLYAGTGYGGSCFPKDTRALVHTATNRGMRMRVVEAVEAVNARQKDTLVQLVTGTFGSDLRGVRLAVWGLAFKPNTNDMREAPSRHIMAALYRLGATLCAYDPVAVTEARAALSTDLGHSTTEMGQRMSFADNPMQALAGADALLVVTEWKCFHNPDFPAMAQCMRHRIVLDGRNLYEPLVMQEAGLAYQGIGRRNALGRQVVGAGPQALRTVRHPASAPAHGVAQGVDTAVPTS